MRYSSAIVATGLKLSDEIGVKAAAAELGVYPSTIGRWRRSRKEGKVPDCTPISRGQFLRHIHDLEKEAATLRQTNKLLLEALNVANGTQQDRPDAKIEIHNK